MAQVERVQEVKDAAYDNAEVSHEGKITAHGKNRRSKT
jgi:hypothetical protein